MSHATNMSMSLKPDQERVKNLLSDTVTLLCKNGLTFSEEMKVEAVIGVTVDQEVFLVHINECVKNPDAPRSNSPDVEASDNPPPGLMRRERSAAERRRQAAAAKKQTQGKELFVDLTGRDTGVRGSPNQQGRFMSTSPRARSPRMVGQPTTPTRRGPYTSPVASPRTPNGGRFQSPVMSYPQNMQMAGGRGGRFVSPQQVRGQYSPRQQFNPLQVSPGARRSLNTALNRAMPPPMQSVRSPRQGSPLRTRKTANGEEVIVLDEPISGQRPSAAPQPRVLGQMAPAATSTPVPLTIEPVTIEPQTSQSAATSEDSQPTTVTPIITSTTSLSANMEEAASAPPEASSSPKASEGPAESDKTESEKTETDKLELDKTSPTVTEPPVLTETEEQVDDSLSQLASVIGDQQKARTSADSAPGTPKSVGSPLDHAQTASPEITKKSAQSPAPAATEATIAALQEVAKDTVAELQKTGSTEVPPTEKSDTTPQVLTPPPTSDSGDDIPALSVSCIEGNYTKYDQLGTLPAVKKPPPEDTDDQAETGEPPAKRRALSPGATSSAPAAEKPNSPAKPMETASTAPNSTPIKADPKETASTAPNPTETASTAPTPAPSKAPATTESGGSKNTEAATASKPSPEAGPSKTPPPNDDAAKGTPETPETPEVKKEEEWKPVTTVMETSKRAAKPSESSGSNSSNRLTPWQVREHLESLIVTRVLNKKESHVISFRLVWKGDSATVANTWKDIVLRRQELDDMVAKEQYLSFYISSITVENAPAASFPCVGYWVVTRHPAFDKTGFIERVKAVSHGAELRLVLKADGGTMDEFGALCQMVKDLGDGKVQRHITESAKEAKMEVTPAMVRFVLKENFFEHMLKTAMKQLKNGTFTASLEKVI